MNTRINKFDLKINIKLFNFINNEVLPNTGISENNFWQGFSKLIYKFNHINIQLIKKRHILQDKINQWNLENISNKFNYDSYINFLKKIDYLVDEKSDFKIDTKNIDQEIAKISGPQLVVPITNARYVLNAANSRWGSLYDAIYGTNVLGTKPDSKKYDLKRGEKVIKYAKKHLDLFAPLINANWCDVSKIKIVNKEVKFEINHASFSSLKNTNQLVGFKKNPKNNINELVLKKNNLHCRIILDPDNLIGKNDIANISDIILESAISAIIDCEDSVATVDTEDKILAYKNWLGLMKGNLKSEFSKNNKIIKRSLNEDIELTDISNNKFFLKGRSLLLIRNVGHLMTTSSILDNNNIEIGEGLMDALVTSLISLHDLNKTDGIRNSYCGSIYIVKPKMHGPEEVEFTNNLFSYIEGILKLPLNTIKIGIMDEERRTSINLKECIRAAKSRVAFINTGFLDRTGDEIHTSMMAGPFIKKNDMKNSTWIKAYENRNVEIGLKCGLKGKAQIGKGMWAMPDLMLEMVKNKINHPRAGSNCAWVPSPTAATLHAMHYHIVNVDEVQNQIIKNNQISNLQDLLTLPLLKDKKLSQNEIISEIENNAQGILGYVVRWVDQGIGCSKVLDINNVGLMEDRATCRISSQAISNWLYHQLITKDQVVNIFKKMAKVVDLQNMNDPKYTPMCPSFDNFSFKAACDLVFLGIKQPSGYTEPILHKRRLEVKEL